MLEALKARITALEAELATSQAELAAEQQRSAGHRADLERERDRGDRLDAALHKTIAEMQAVRALLEAAQAVTAEPVHVTAAAGDRPGDRVGDTSWRWPLALWRWWSAWLAIAERRAGEGERPLATPLPTRVLLFRDHATSLFEEDGLTCPGRKFNTSR